MQSGRKESAQMRTAQRSPQSALLATRFMESHGKELYSLLSDRIMENKVQIDHQVYMQLDKYKTRVRELEDELLQQGRTLEFTKREAALERERGLSHAEGLRAELEELRRQMLQQIRNLHERYKSEKEKTFQFHQEDICYYESRLLQYQADMEELRRREREAAKQLDYYKEEAKMLGSEVEKARTLCSNLQMQMEQNAQSHAASLRAVISELDSCRRLHESEMTNLKIQRERDLRQFDRVTESTMDKHRLELDNLRAQHRQAESSMTHSHEMQRKRLEDQNRNYLQRLKDAELVISRLDESLSAKGAQCQSLSAGVKGKSNQVQSLAEQAEALRSLGTMLKERIAILQDNNMKALQQNRLLGDELQDIRAVLRESSYQLDQCREEIILCDRQKASLRLLVEESERERDRTLLLLRDKEGEAGRWRDSYYTLKGRF